MNTRSTLNIERPGGFTYAVFVEHSEDQRGKFRRIALRKELLVDLYEALKSRNRHSYLRAVSFLRVSIDFRLINVPAENEVIPVPSATRPGSLSGILCA